MANISLDNIVRSYLVGQGRTTTHGYLRYLKYVLDIVRKVSLQYAVMTKSVALRMDQKKSIQFPADCLVPLAIGFLNGDRIETFQIDTTIALTHSYVEDAVSATPNSIFQNLTSCNFVANDGSSYGVNCHRIGYNYNGYFRIDRRNREIQFSSEVDSSVNVYLFFRSNGFNPRSKTTISEVFQKLCEDYIHYQDAAKKLGNSSAETEARRINFEREQTDVLQILMPLTHESILGARARTMDFNKIVS